MGSSQPDKPADDESGAGPVPPRARVLLVEDDPLIAMAVTDDLAAHGYEIVARADNGREAIALAEQHAPDLVVMDVRLRGRMTGLEAAREIKARIRTRVVFATAFVDVGTRTAMATVGYEGLLAKPYTTDQLVSAVEGALRT